MFGGAKVEQWCHTTLVTQESGQGVLTEGEGYY